jgi:hypothetical protein
MEEPWQNVWGTCPCGHGSASGSNVSRLFAACKGGAIGSRLFAARPPEPRQDWIFPGKRTKKWREVLNSSNKGVFSTSDRLKKWGMLAPGSCRLAVYDSFSSNFAPRQVLLLSPPLSSLFPALPGRFIFPTAPPGPVLRRERARNAWSARGRAALQAFGWHDGFGEAPVLGRGACHRDGTPCPPLRLAGAFPALRAERRRTAVSPSVWLARR